MSNLSRKVRKATEPFSKSAERAKRRYQKRLKATKGRSLFGSCMDNKIKALNELSETQRKSYTNDQGVVDLDKLKYVLNISWRPLLGWYPEWKVIIDNKEETNSLTFKD